MEYCKLPTLPNRYVLYYNVELFCTNNTILLVTQQLSAHTATVFTVHTQVEDGLIILELLQSLTAGSFTFIFPACSLEYRVVFSRITVDILAFYHTTAPTILLM